MNADMERKSRWERVLGKWLLLRIDLVSATALIFEGYNQGVYGTVSGTPGFIKMAGIGHDNIVTDSTKQGGLAAAYYFGAMCACFFGGSVGDRIGRKRGTVLGCLVAAIGAILQFCSQNSNMFICARVITGIGIAFLNTIVITWVSELTQAHNRGSNFALVFTANFVGIAISSWVNFWVRNCEDEFRWRFPLAFMILPLIIVLCTVPFLPESPRWLIVNRRSEDAIAILRKLRGDLAEDGLIKTEVSQLKAIIEANGLKRNRLVNIMLNGRHSGRLHLGRRAVLGFALQWLQQWSGILAVVGWADTLFKLAGFDDYKSLVLSGSVNLVGIVGTLAAAGVIDRMGRIKSLIASFVAQAITLFSVAALIKTGQDALTNGEHERASRLGTTAAAFVFIYMWLFTMFNIVPVWVYGSEIWPQEIRAKGYSFTIFGWATGCGMTQFLIPIMLSRLGYGTFLFFGVINIVSIPLIWLVYPETANCTLEKIILLFTGDSLLANESKNECEERTERAGGSESAAACALLVEVDEANADVKANQNLATV